MKYKFIVMILLFNWFEVSQAQITIDSVLHSVALNNKSLLANRNLTEANKLQYRAGIAPADPFVEYDYLIGSPESAGNQQEFSIVQSLEFPTSYIKKSQLATQKQIQADLQYDNLRKEILFDAQKACIELIYLGRLQNKLVTRLKDAESIAKNYKFMLNNGEGNILDYNKAALQLIDIRKQFNDNVAAIGSLNAQLTALNGGEKISFTDTEYPVFEVIPVFDVLEPSILSADPVRKLLEQEQIIGQKQLEVSKSLWLPRLEAGYHYQGILGQTYNGVHTGISIPLWENSKTVKLAKAELLWSQTELESHKAEQYYQTRRLYDEYMNLGNALKEYQEVFTAADNAALLYKAFNTGHISSMEYFVETNLFYSAYNNYLMLERDYYIKICELNKYKL